MQNLLKDGLKGTLIRLVLVCLYTANLQQIFQVPGDNYLLRVRNKNSRLVW